MYHLPGVKKKYFTYKTKNVFISYFRDWKTHTLFLDYRYMSCLITVWEPGPITGLKEKYLHWSTIVKTLLYIGNSPNWVSHWLISVVCSKLWKTSGSKRNTESTSQIKYCYLYHQLSVDSVFSVLKRTQNCYLIPTHMFYLKGCPEHLTKYESKGTSTNSITQLFSELRSTN